MPCTYHAESCYKIKGHVSWCQLRLQYENKKKILPEEKVESRFWKKGLTIAEKVTVQRTMWILKFIIVRQWKYVLKERL